MELIYLDRYHFFNRHIIDTDSPVVVKVGVCGVDDIRKLKQIYPKAVVAGYEACPENFEKQQPAARKYFNLFINSAVGGSEPVTLYRFKNIVSNSIYPRHRYDPNCVARDKVVIDSISIGKVIEDWKRVHILILNCEGGELKIMDDLKNKIIRDKIDQICVSFHDPRIYPTSEKQKVFDWAKDWYHIIKGDCQKGGIPDYLLVRKA